MLELEQSSKSNNISYFIIYISTLLAFVSLVLHNRRSYQDSWILLDIFLPLLFFVFICLFIILTNDNNKLITFFCSMFIVVLTLIPALKYDLFYGIADTTQHYYIINHIIKQGYVPPTIYSNTPNMHILVSLFAMILGLSPNAGIKYALPIIYGIIPFLFYLISSKILLNKKMQKYIIIASALPLITAYYLVGSIFPLPILLILCTFPLIREFEYKQYQVSYSIILIGMLFTLMLSHTITSLIFILLSTGAIISLILINLIYIKDDSIKNILRNMSKLMFLATILFTAWWMYEADFLFHIFIKSFQNLFMMESILKAPIPTRFFEIPAMAKIKIFSIYHIKDAIIALLSLIGVIVLMKSANTNKRMKNFYFYIISFLMIIVFFILFELLSGYGDLEYYRFINYGIIFSPFFVGLTLYQLDSTLNSTFYKSRVNIIIMVCFIFLIIILSFIQFFPYQPFTPKLDTISEDLPKDEPLMYFQLINSIYQIDMIFFASTYFPSNCTDASDSITRLQMIAFSNRTYEDFKQSHVYISPLMENTEIDWDFFLLHWNGKSGPFNEQAEYRTNHIISENRNMIGRNIIYDNGESFILNKKASQNNAKTTR